MDSLDDVLARLKFDRGQWEATIRVPCWPEPIDVHVSADEAGPSTYQRRVLEAILRQSSDLKQLAEEPVFRSCVDLAGETFETLDEECNFVAFEFPELTEASEIWQLLELPTIDIHQIEERDHIEFEISFHCKWDVEHCSLRVRFRDFKVIEVD